MLLGGVINAEEGVESVDKRTLSSARAGEFGRENELRVCIETFKDPSTGA
jgi:hypothetical protein